MDKYSAHDRGFVVSTPGKIIINFYGPDSVTNGLWDSNFGKNHPNTYYVSLDA